MSKRAPGNLQGIRIELQEKERLLAENYINAYSVDKYSEAIDQLLSFENLYIGTTIVEMVTGREILPGTPNDIYQLIDWFRDWWHNGGGSDSTLGDLLRNQAPEEVRAQRATSFLGGLQNMADTFFAVITGGQAEAWFAAQNGATAADVEPNYGDIAPDYIDPGLAAGLANQGNQGTQTQGDQEDVPIDPGLLGEDSPSGVNP